MVHSYTTILAVGGGVDIFSLIGIVAFMVISFVAQRAKKVQEMKEREKAPPPMLSDTPEPSAPISPAQSNPKEDWFSFERQLREMFGEDTPMVPPPPSVSSEELNSAQDVLPAYVPKSSGSQVKHTPVRDKQLDVREIASKPKALGVGSGKQSLQEKLSSLKGRVSDQVKGLDIDVPKLPLTSVRATKIQSANIPATQLRAKLQSQQNLRDFVVISTLLGPPKALSSEERGCEPLRF